jgi:hypothetical protein
MDNKFLGWHLFSFIRSTKAEQGVAKCVVPVRLKKLAWHLSDLTYR